MSLVIGNKILEHRIKSQVRQSKLNDSRARRYEDHPFISFSEEFRGSGKVWCQPKESTSQVLSGVNPESGKLANKLVNKFDLLGRLISAVQCILLLNLISRWGSVKERWNLV